MITLWYITMKDPDFQHDGSRQHEYNQGVMQYEVRLPEVLPVNGDFRNPDRGKGIDGEVKMYIIRYVRTVL